MTVIRILILLAIIRPLCDASYDVDEKELRYLSHHLTDLECRRLVQALHMHATFLDPYPDGSGVAKNMSCIQLLEQWDRKESRTESFVRMAQRLRGLGKNELAKRFSQAVFKDKERMVDEFVLPKREALTDEDSPHVEQSPNLINNPEPKDPKEVHPTVFDGRPGNTMGFLFPDWSLSQKVLFVISTVFTVGLFGFWFFHCIPDCLRALCEICRRKPHANPDDAAHFLLSELDDGDA
ncbi:hypothetical protein BV898_16303 [Hypsibius exemplaris]|uniref:Death domain-containing protein n=1 Tax=Hypsibius exemplaris TaxID=2072580 RepID=A0A9X6NFQ0_HYPEX|nr:hypothetical protein BV898_16303 [Hypsibius exemplaris]